MAEVGLTTVTSSEPEPSSQSPSLPPIAPMDLTVKAPTIPDDRDNLSEQDKIVLIIEDDVKFAKIVYDFAQRQGFKGLVAVDGQSGLALVRAYQPDAIILDLRLPDITGWEVMEILKHDPATRHIPVHIISAEEEMLDAYRRGAIGYLTKPVGVADLAGSFERIEQFIAQSIKSLLLVEDDGPSRQSIKALLGGSDVQISEAARGEQALQMLKAQHFDCLILDLSLPDMSGFEVLNRLNEVEGLGHCPVIVYTGRDSLCRRHPIRIQPW
jgi:CheY-like chemotaxis protein